MLILLKKVKANVTPKQIIQPIVSLGMPTEIFRGNQKNTWALKMPSEQDAADAAFILNKNITFMREFFGDGVSISHVSRLPPNISFVSKSIVGRGEA